MERHFLNGKLVDSLPESDDEITETSPILLFISGDKSQVGKSSVCLGILSALLDLYPKSALAYIKPATQCEAQQPVNDFCKEKGIAFVEESEAPIIFFAGFTRAFLDGETETSPQLLEKAKQAVDKLKVGKKVVVVDGVGYPAVGSICGVSNAVVAKKLGASVVLVGKSGVGDAVDSFNLNATFFESHDVPVLGGIFNRCAVDGFYSADKIAPYIRKFFEKNRPKQMPFGFLPEMEQPIDPSIFAAKFKERIDMKEILKRAREMEDHDTFYDAVEHPPSPTKTPTSAEKPLVAAAAPLMKVPDVVPFKLPSDTFKIKTRAEIATSAISIGAKGG